MFWAIVNIDNFKQDWGNDIKMRYYTADLHFFHENLNTKMDKRDLQM